MAIDAYSPCPCGSGKKFKWCCQPIHQEIDHALQQDQEGQHEAALRAMDEVVRLHADNPEAWGRRALLLYRNGRAEDAENSLQRAFSLNPNYPFGFLLRGLFRQQEGEVPGALLLFRKAAEVYDSDAREILAQVYQMMADCELRLNRPVAARAALKISLRCRPSDELREEFDSLFGEDSYLPKSARKEYSFQSPSARSAPERLASWERALGGASSGKLADVLHAFEKLTQEIPEDASAWYNLGLARAWLGDNKQALEALDRYISLQSDEDRAAAALALGEVLRLGYGMEDLADHVEYSLNYQVRNVQAVVNMLQEWGRAGRSTGVQIDEQRGAINGVIVEKGTALTPEAEAALLPHYAAYFVMVGDLLRIWNTDQKTLERLGEQVKTAAGTAVAEVPSRRGPCRFADVWAPMLVFPVGATSQEEAEKLVREHVRKYFEETWINQPLRSLDGFTPAAAAQDPARRKKLRGVLQFIEECAGGGVNPYEFDNLRRKLGLIEGVKESAAEQPQAAGSMDISSLTAEQLAALQPENLQVTQLEEAYQSAKKLGAADAATRFARALVAQPPDSSRPDRYPLYSYLIQNSLNQGDPVAALNAVDEGERADCEHNQGRRRNEYELRRGQVLIKCGEVDKASEVFERLLDRAPSELHYRVTAVESLLSAKQGSTALRLAEEGLAKARQKNDRDSEGHFQELLGAARRLAT